MRVENWQDLISWTYSGVDFSLAGNGGYDCVDFIPGVQKIIETICVLIMCSVEMWIAYPHLLLPNPLTLMTMSGQKTEGVGKRILLVVMCLTFGIEMGFKFATSQMIWILNPCHIITMIQIFLLTAPASSKLVMAVFRLHIHMLTGPTLALICPVLNTRLLPFEVEIYYIQHGLMLIIPIYLMSLGGVFTVEPLNNYYWTFAALSIFLSYHFVPLQFLAITLQLNLNSIICPAISDPFYGRWFRSCAIVHQTIFILLHGKFYTFLALKITKETPKQRHQNLTTLSNGHDNKKLT